MYAGFLRVAALGSCAIALCGGFAQADTIDFEGYSTGTAITNQYAAEGVGFQNAFILHSPDYNYTGYPPHSGSNVIYSDTSSYIEIDNTSGGTWDSVSIWGTSAINGLFLDAYDSSNNLIGTDSITPNYGTNSLLSLSLPGIAYVRVHDHGNFFTADDFSFNGGAAAAPLPSTAWAGLPLLGGFGVFMVKRRRALSA